jgi:hypothetical protein
MTSPRVAMYKRLPEIYRIRDAEQVPQGQLEAYVDLFDEVHSAVRDNIESLGRDAFIESCADWVVPYIADLLGTSHLSGDPWTLRADVARTINHRRRKGTLGAIESLAHALSGWAAHVVEMRDRLVWNQHINHQRPDAGGAPPLGLSKFLSDARRGGTVNLRDPALLSLLNGPFDPFAHLSDVKPSSGWRGLYNLPNLGIFLWRLQHYTVARTRPGQIFAPIPLMPAKTAEANFAVRVELHPQSEPMVLFNTHRFHADDEPPNISSPDAVPGPMPAARLNHNTPAGRPEHYVEIVTYPFGTVPPRMNTLGLSLQVPQGPFTPATPWVFRGANLCAWETGLQPPLRAHEIAIDPDRGRIVFGAMGALAADEADDIVSGLYVSPTHGFSGPVGAQPIPRQATPTEWLETAPIIVSVDPLNNAALTLQAALTNLQLRAQPLIIEIKDSLVHELDLSTIAGTSNELGLQTLRLNRSLWIRAADGERPVVRLKQALAFRPHDVLSAGAPAIMDSLMVRLEGIYLTRDKVSFPANTPLIARAALNQLHIQDCTLDPGGYVALNNIRTPILETMRLDNSYGFVALSDEEKAFDQTPEIILENSISGPLAIDDDYLLTTINSIIDAGGTLETPAPAALAVGTATGSADSWGPALTVNGLTCFGRMRVTSASGKGGIWVHALQVHNNQIGCIKNSWFASANNRLPSNHVCLHQSQSDLHFVAQTFGQPGYAQISRDSDFRILEQGPNDDEMGAFGFLLNSHKWKNITIRFREYMPVGIRPVLIAVT